MIFISIKRRIICSIKAGNRNNSLGYLSEFYGIEHKDKHRISSDAEANAEIYLNEYIKNEKDNSL